MKTWWTVTRWHVEDVISAAAAQGMELTKTQAPGWRQKHERHFVDMLTQYGNEVLTETDFLEEESK